MGLGVVHDLCKSSEIAVDALALVVVLQLAPLDMGSPAIKQVWVTNFVRVFPVVLDCNLA